MTKRIKKVKLPYTPRRPAPRPPAVQIIDDLNGPPPSPQTRGRLRAWYRAEVGSCGPVPDVPRRVPPVIHTGRAVFVGGKFLAAERVVNVRRQMVWTACS